MSSLVVLSGFSGESAFAQVRFQIAIHAIPACRNGIDDDGDSLIDYPSDTGCTSASDTSEGAPFLPPTVACFASSTHETVGNSVTWIAIPSNGNGTYTYIWSGSDSLASTDASVTKTYTSPGTKNASIIVSSGGMSSALIACANTVTITAASSGGGGGGGGGGAAIIPPKPSTLPIVSPPSEIPPNTISPDVGEEANLSCSVPGLDATFQTYKNYLVCDDLITERVTEEHYEYEKPTPRKELLGVAVEIALKDKSTAIREGLSHLSSQTKPTQVAELQSPRPFHFLDVGIEGQPEWVVQTVQKGVILGLVSTENTYFRPDDNVTRAEAFAMLMKAICMNPDDSVYPTWEERVYATAKRYNLTTRDWQTFQPKSSVLRQELFVITSKLDIWRDVTGGCTPKSIIAPLPPILQNSPATIMPPTSTQPSPTGFTTANTSVLTTDTGNTTPAHETQKPGTFVFLYENETEKVYAYIVKSGGIPDGVRLQYIRTFGGGKGLVNRLSIRNIAGEEFDEKRWLLSGEMIFVYLEK